MGRFPNFSLAFCGGFGLQYRTMESDVAAWNNSEEIGKSAREDREK
jgi:hypothetical protein